jgi:hypothetical protein
LAAIQGKSPRKKIRHGFDRWIPAKGLACKPIALRRLMALMALARRRQRWDDLPVTLARHQ